MTTNTNTQDHAARRAATSKETKEGDRLPVGQVLVGDASTRLSELPPNSVDTVVTSPPYFLLRDYGVPGQIGAERTVDEWVANLVAVLEEVARVLKPTGSVWLNLGDTFSRHDRHGALPKSLVLAPERLALALITTGWRVRSKVVWAKPNPMPASVRDRLSSTWEPMLLLTRERHYFFDLDAIRIPARSHLNGPSKIGANTKYAAAPNERPRWSGPLAGSNSGLPAMKARGASSHPLGKNPGDVWTIPTAAYRGAHFATFPEALVERPLRATCPERVCRSCGQPWRRAPVARALGMVAVLGALRKSCGCSGRRWRPGVVLDPFMGAGTVALVAERLHRQWVGVELNPRFAAMAEERAAAGSDRRADDGHPTDPEDDGQGEGGQAEVTEAPAAVPPARLVGDAPNEQGQVEGQPDQQQSNDESEQTPAAVVPTLEVATLGVGVDADRDYGGQEQHLDRKQRSPGQVAEAHQPSDPPPARHIRRQRRVRHQVAERPPLPRLEQPAQRPQHKPNDQNPSEPRHRVSIRSPYDSGGRR